MRRWSTAALCFALAACGKQTSPQPSDGGGAKVACTPTDASTSASAEFLTQGTLTAVPLCAIEKYYALDLVAGDLVTLSVTFAHAAGDIDVVLIDPDGTSLAQSTSSTDTEQFTTARAALAGRHFVRVYSKLRVKLSTQFNLTFTLGHDSSCTDDPLEPNDSAAAATPVSPDGGTFAGLKVCPSNKDHFRVDLVAGDSFTASLANAPSSLSLNLYRLDADAPSPVKSLASGTTLSFGPAALASTAYVSVAGTWGATSTYDLSITRTANPAGRTVNLSGQVSYERELVTAAGYSNQGFAPVASMRVEAVATATGQALAQVVTTDAGAFQFPPLLMYGDAGIRLRALAQRFDALAKVQVLENPATNAVVSALSASVDETDAGASLSINLQIALSSGAAGAFHIITTAAAAFSFVRSAYARSLPALNFFWTQGSAVSCYTCYDGLAVYIGSAPSDPDEFDDAVIIHEIGHHVMQSFSRVDTPGGSHNGSRTEPTLALAEGFAEFFALAVRNDPLFLDYRVADVASRNYETMTDPNAFGTSTGTESGDVSERLVTATMWDMFDPSQDSGDSLISSHAALFDPLATYLISPWFVDRGKIGRDFVDYLDGWFCRGFAQVGEMTTLLAARQFPYTFQGPASCPE